MLIRCGRGVLALLLVAGCFSNPPAGGTPDGGSTSEDTTTTTVPPTTMPPTTVATTIDPGTTSTGDDESTSTSSSSSSESGGESTSTGHDDDSTGSGPACPRGEVLIGALCVAPLVVTDAVTVVAPPDPSPTGGAPCIQAECLSGRPLGGGFAFDGLLAHSAHRNADMVSWITCAGPDLENDDELWQGYARCSEAEGDVFVVSESYELDGDEGTACYDVTCPDGATLIGGGGRWGPTFDFQGSEPDDDGSHWRVCGSGGMEPTEVEVDAYCTALPEGSEVAVLSESVEVPGGMSDCVDVSCPTGIAVSGGGFGVVTSVLEASHPLPGDADGWRACGRADGIFTLTVRARVMCLQG